MTFAKTMFSHYFSLGFIKKTIVVFGEELAVEVRGCNKDKQYAILARLFVGIAYVIFFPSSHDSRILGTVSL